MTVESIRLKDCEERYAPSEKLLEIAVVDEVVFLQFLTYTGVMHGGLDEYVQEKIIGVDIDSLRAALDLLA